MNVGIFNDLLRADRRKNGRVSKRKKSEKRQREK
jgi:hypothetical protein